MSALQVMWEVPDGYDADDLLPPEGSSADAEGAGRQAQHEEATAAAQQGAGASTSDANMDAERAAGAAEALGAGASAVEEIEEGEVTPQGTPPPEGSSFQDLTKLLLARYVDK